MILVTALKGWFSRYRGAQHVYPDATEDRDINLPDYLADHKDLISNIDYNTIRAACLYVYNRFPIVQGAIADKANFVVGNAWNAQFYGEDDEWGNEAENWLLNWGNVCDVRGQPYNFTSNLLLGEKTFLSVGEYFTYYRKNPDGYPLKQTLESFRIGDRSSIKSWTDDKGREFSVRNGIAYNAESRPMFYHFLGDTKDQDAWIPARDITHHYNPLFFSQGRGISPLVVGILDWLDVHECRENEKFAQRIFSSLAMKWKTPTGKPDANVIRFGNKTTTTATDGSTATAPIVTSKKGGIRWLISGKEDLEPFETNRPGINTQTFEETVVRGALIGLGWGYEQVVKSTLSGAAVRRDISKCQRSVEAEQGAMIPFWMHEVRWAVACAIQMGILRQSTEWWMFAPQLPTKMTADAFRDDDSERENYKLGTTTLQDISSRRGQFWKDIRIQREKEAKDLLDRAKNIMKDYPELSFNDCINLLEQRTPNGNASTSNNDKDNDTNDSKERTSSNDTKK
jgi:capsid protein